jgi:hypothetical protein
MTVAILIIFIYATLLFLIVNWLEHEKALKIKNVQSGFTNYLQHEQFLHQFHQ